MQDFSQLELHVAGLIAYPIQMQEFGMPEDGEVGSSAVDTNAWNRQIFINGLCKLIKYAQNGRDKTEILDQGFPS